MKCPHCEKEIELTWRRYWKAPHGRHICPYCEQCFQMKHTFKYYSVLSILCVIFGLIPAGIALWLGATELQALAVYLISSAVFILPIDKRIDSTWRGTLPLRKGRA
jgi:hypothetical protein